MTIYSISGNAPQIAGTARVAPQATLIGRVELAERASVWFGGELRHVG